jgi:hypothetical protein
MKFLNLLIVLFLLYNNFGGTSSSSGGDLPNITYPYFLPGTCRWKAFELQRDGNDTVLYVDDIEYQVKDLSVTDKTLTLVQPDLAVRNCGVTTYTQFQSFMNIGDVSRIYFYRILSTYAVSVFNCTEELEDTKLYKLKNYTTGPGSKVYAALNFYGDYDAVNTIPRSCRYVGRAMTSYDLGTIWDDIDDAHLMQILRKGFVVSWDPGNEDIKKICSPLQLCWSYTFR